MAVNVVEGAVPESAIVVSAKQRECSSHLIHNVICQDARHLYETHVKPFLKAERSEVICFKLNSGSG